MTETWRPINGFPFYEVSDQGRVRSWNTRSRKPDEIRPRRANPLVLLQTTHRIGYKGVTLCRARKTHFRSVHRLVAQAFVPNPKDHQVVKHRNGIMGDNRAENLAWAYNQNAPVDSVA